MKAPPRASPLAAALLASKLTWLHHMRGLLIVLKMGNGLGQSGEPILALS